MFTNIHTRTEHAHLSPMHKHLPGQRLQVAICLLHTHHPPEIDLSDSHKHTPRVADEESNGRQSHRLWWHSQHTRLGISSSGSSDSLCRADRGRLGSWRAWSSSSQTLPLRCPHQLPAVSVHTPLCKATSCVTFTLTLSSGVLAAHFPDFRQPHRANAGGCGLWF